MMYQRKRGAGMLAASVTPRRVATVSCGVSGSALFAMREIGDRLRAHDGVTQAA